MACTGRVKSFNQVKSFGFIEFQGADIFVHVSDCKGGIPKQGDLVAFDIEESEKKPGSKKASNVTGGSGAMKGVMGNGSCRGVVKSFNAMKGFGFIEYEGGDVFVHVKDCEGGAPQQGDTVAFDIEESQAKPGSKKASNVTGGTGNLQPPMSGEKGDWGGKGDWGAGKGDWGAGKGDWGYGGYGPMCGGKGGKGGWGGDAGPYGGKGDGKGWGMSWW